ncbi:MAG: hypothetical protein HUN04_06695 [Desulfobacter sp.]|nr:MAG: hypothetical protein HUN04_06695 [Desulfobacter sp.]
MKLSVPFIPDPDYAGFLAARSEMLSSLYFPLDTAIPFDARVKLCGVADTAQDRLARLLSPLSDVKKYILMNTRFVPPEVYMDKGGLRRFLDTLSRLAHAVGIQGIVVSDLYLLNALDRTGHDIIPRLEAVPGVNTMLDSPEKLFSHLEMIGQTRFALPGRIIPDRSLNRNPDRLRDMYTRVKAAYPDMSIELLANEGCIYHCPFKPAHDAHIALSNTGLVREATWEMNRTMGCHAYFSTNPHKFLKSPFIRPEDAIHYRGMADSLKLCGRTIGTAFLKQCIRAYSARSFKGNLLALMDTARFMADRINISNHALGPNFFKTLTTCTKECKQCRICDTIFEQTAEIKPVGLKAYEDIQ